MTEEKLPTIENLDVTCLFGGIYSGRRVLVTGHTGFKGSWLSLWLTRLGAKVIGYALDPPTQPNHFELLKLPIISIIGDIRDRDNLFKTFAAHSPEIVFHLAAQPLVRRSYANPAETFETNVMGTINVLEACRNKPSVKAIVNITSDKCYDNREWYWGYREIDPVGGYDPYSASKACAELVTTCYKRSFFNPDNYLKKHNILLASARAGNVIGGGDWAEDRLIPDIVKAESRSEITKIRNPQAIRPWQHVLEPISAYLLLGQKLFEGATQFSDPWNFGPEEKSNITVLTLIEKMKTMWDKIAYKVNSDPSSPHEAFFLKLDCSKARVLLSWNPVWDINKTIYITTRWYKEFYENGKIMSELDLTEYLIDAKKQKVVWMV